MRFWASCLFSLVVSVVSGCSSLDSRSDTAAGLLGVGGGQNSATTGGAGSAGAGGGTGSWGCLEQRPTLLEQPPERIQYLVGIVDFDSQPPPNTPTSVPGLQVTVCGSPSCDPPFSAPDVVTVNPIEGQPSYVWMIDFPYNFSNAYLRLTAPNYAPMEYFFGGPLKGPPEGGHVVRGLTIPLLKEATRDTIYNDLGLPGPADPTRGVLAVRTLDCRRSAQGQGQRAAGVRLRAIPSAPDAPAVAWTLSFSNRATPNKLETDARGVAGFVNVVPGTVDIEGVAPLGDGGTPYGATTLPVRAGVITLAEVRYGLDLWGQ